jgi:UMF1 family MFS transporter
MSVVDDGRETVPSAPDRKREQRGWVWYDWANQVFPTTVTAVFGALYLTAVAANSAMADTATNGPNPCPEKPDGSTNKLVDCQIDVFGLHFQAGSLWGYLLAVATVIQVLVVPVLGAIADRTHRKKRMLAITAFGGSLA